MKEMPKRLSQVTFKWWVCALLAIGWSFIGERGFFDFTQMDAYGWKLYIAVKIIFCIASFITCYYVKQFRFSDVVAKYRDAIRLAMPIIIVYIVMFILLYPGIWIGDDMLVLEYASRFKVVWNQGIMITVWDMFWMMLIPIPAFLVLLQQIMLIGVAIRLFSLMEISTINSQKRYLACIPFLLPSTLYYMLFTHRSSTVALLELIVALVIICKNKHTRFSIKESFFLGIIIAIIPGMRTETYIIAIAYIIAIVLKF